jgi:hypothetical protein
MEAQKDFKELQKAGIGIAHIAIGGGLAACAVLVNFYPQAVLFIAGAGIAAWAAWTAAERKREAREAAARAASYANICGPVVIQSIHPNETVDEVRARAAEFKDQLRISGNAYWNQIPVIAYPYQPMIYGPGQLAVAWNIYQRQAGDFQHTQNQAWANECPEQLRGLFLSQVMPQPAQTETV